MLGSSSTIRILVIALLTLLLQQVLTTLREVRPPTLRTGQRPPFRSARRPKPLRRRRVISACSPTQRQSNDKLAALAGRALDRDLASVGADYVAHQGKAQAAPLRVVNQRVADAIELVEYLLLLAGWNADAVIDHFKLDRAVVAVQLHAQILLILRILERVVHQVYERTRNRLAVNPDTGQVAGDIFLKGEAVLLDLVSVGLERVVRQLANIGFAKVVLFPARLDAGKVKNVVDEGGQALALLADNAVVFLVFLPAAQAAHLQGFRVKPDQRQRSSQFVRNVGHEIGFQPGQRHLLHHVAIGEQNSARQEKGKAAQDQEAGMSEVLAQRRQGGPLQFDGEGQAGERPFQVPLHLGRAPIPLGRLRQRV